MKNTILLLLLATSSQAAAECGKASWYGKRFAGKPTASGEIFHPNKLTAAHKTLPLGTRLRVTYKGRSVVVKVNDRGPYVKGRKLDLSRAAAEKLGMKKKGVATVCFSKL